MKNFWIFGCFINSPIEVPNGQILYIQRIVLLYSPRKQLLEFYEVFTKEKRYTVDVNEEIQSVVQWTVEVVFKFHLILNLLFEDNGTNVKISKIGNDGKIFKQV